MNENYYSGQVVRLSSAEGAIERVLVRDLGEVLLICRADEYESARIERREPVSIGFPKRDLISVIRP